MQLVGFTLILFVISCIMVATVLSASFIWIGSKLAGIQKATFGKAFISALLSSVAVWSLTGYSAVHIGLESISVWLLGLAVTIGILKLVYAIDWGKAFLLWICTGIAHVIVGIIAVALLITGAVVLEL